MEKQGHSKRTVISRRIYTCIAKCILVLIIPTFSRLMLAYNDFSEFDYPSPFRPFYKELPVSDLETIYNNDILFVGETHIISAVLSEKNHNSRNENARRNSLSQELYFFSLVKVFSELHATAKKCLWLEYVVDISGLEQEQKERYNYLVDLEQKLNGLHEYRSHYWLIHTAKAEGWSVFAVDGYPKEGTARDPYMAENISKTLQKGQCEKGISVNGNLHLSCTAEYPDVFCRKGLLFPSLDKLLEDNLKTAGLVKSIGILRVRLPHPL